MNQDLSRTRTWFGALIVGAALFVGACSSAATPAPTAAPTPAPTVAAPSSAPSTAASPAPSTAAAAPVEIDVATSATLGKYITGKGGLTVYSYKPDAAATGKSVCNDQCAANWPPVIVSAASDATAGAGVSGAIATITRDDGTTQVTYKGVPLYYFKGDAKAGDTSGNGTKDVWFVIAP